MGQGGGGDDFIDVCGHFDVTDQFDGGTGTDTIELTASDAGATGYTGANALVLTASMMSNIEVMQLDPWRRRLRYHDGGRQCRGGREA